MLTASLPLLVDFGTSGANTSTYTLSTAYTGGTTITTPAHQDGGLALSYDIYNNIGPANPTSLAWGDGSAATSVTLKWGRSTVSGGTVNFADAGNLIRNTVATSSATLDEFNNPIANSGIKESVFQNGEEGVSIAGLAAGTYKVFFVADTAENVSDLNEIEIGANLTAYDPTRGQFSGPLHFDGTFSTPSDYVTSAVTLNSGDNLVVLVHGAGGPGTPDANGNPATRQQFNMLEIVPTVLAPATTAAPALPQYGTYVGGGQGAAVNAYGSWLGQSTVYGEDSLPYNGTWSDIEGPSWALNPWGRWKAANPSGKLILSVPMVYGSGGTPYSGFSWNTAGTDLVTTGIGTGYQQGTYTVHFYKLGQMLVSEGLSDSYIRLGWEFNGNWYPWQAGGAGSAANFTGYWNAIVQSMKNVPGENFKVVWNPALGGQTVRAELYYPGSTNVDYIGPDVYDDYTGFYPWSTSTAVNMEQAQERSMVTLLTETDGLDFMRDFAATNGKPLVIPEWGLHDASVGGMDNPFFVQAMAAFMEDPTNKVAWQSYYDITGSTAGDDYQVSPGEDFKDQTAFPNAASTFVSLLGSNPTAVQSDIDIGSPAKAGGSYVNDASRLWTVTGSGNAIDGSSDSFHFASSTVTGDQTVTARVASISAVNPLAKAGLMFRDGTGAATSFADVTVTGSSGILFQYRTGSGVTTTVTASTTSQPAWVKLVRSGNIFTAYYATTLDVPQPSDWILISAAAIASFSSSYQAGLAVTSNSATQTATGIFASFSIQANATASGWASTDIGSSGAAGSTLLDPTAFTATGGGAGINSTSDQFHLAYQSIPSGDDMITTRVDSLTGTSTAAKTGVMFRQSTAANAPFVGILTQPNGSLELDYRSSAGSAIAVASTATVSAISPSEPVWLKLTRNLDSYTAYYAQGAATAVLTTTIPPTSWTLLGTLNLTGSLTGTYLGGLAVTASDNAKLAQATFGWATVGANPVAHTIQITSSDPTYGTPYYAEPKGGSLNQVWADFQGTPTITQDWTVVKVLTGTSQTDNGQIALKNVANGLYLTATVSGTSYVMTTTDTTPGTNSTFSWVDLGNGQFMLRSAATGNMMGNPGLGIALASNDSGSFHDRDIFTNVAIATVITKIRLSPASATVADGQTQSFTATAYDQFNNPMSAPLSWSIDNGGVGSLDANGVYTAPAGGPGTANLRVTSGSVSTTAAVTVTFTTIAGTAGNDIIRLVRNGTLLNAYVNNSTTPAYSVTYAALGALTINTLGGNDTVTIDFSGGATPVPAAGLAIDGGSGNDSLAIVGTTGNDSATVGSSSILFNGSTINYLNQELIAINSSGGSDTLTQTGNPGAALSFSPGSTTATLNISGGTFTVPASGGGITPVTFAVVSVSAGALLSIDGGNDPTTHNVLVSTSLSNSGTLDLGANDLILRGGGTTGLNQITTELTTGLNAGHGYWNGTSGIISSVAATDTTFLTTLGVMLNNTGIAFDNQPSSVGDVLVKHTYYGDANLDGRVDGSDYTLIDNGYHNGPATWHNGDFNDDGVIDGSDYTLIDNVFNSQSTAFAATVAASISNTKLTPAAVFNSNAVFDDGSDQRKPRLHNTSADQIVLSDR